MGILKWQERSPRNLVTAHLSPPPPPPPHMQFKKQNVKKDIHVLLRVCVERGTRIALHSLLLQPCKQVAPRAETPGTDSPTAPGFQTLPGGKRGLRQTPPTHTLPKTPRPFHEDLPPGILDPADLSLYRQARRGKPGRRGHPFRSVPPVSGERSLPRPAAASHPPTGGGSGSGPAPELTWCHIQRLRAPPGRGRSGPRRRRSRFPPPLRSHRRREACQGFSFPVPVGTPHPFPARTGRWAARSGIDKSKQPARSDGKRTERPGRGQKTPPRGRGGRAGGRGREGGGGGGAGGGGRGGRGQGLHGCRCRAPGPRGAAERLPGCRCRAAAAG